MGVRGYIILLLVLAFAGMTATSYKYKSDAAVARAAKQMAIADRDKAVEANTAAQNTISALQEQSRLDSRLTASLVEEMRKISDGLAEQSQQIDELEKSNADVRAYLDTVVPADLRKLRQR